MHAIQKKDAVGNLSEAIDYEEAKDLLKQMRWENRISTGYEALDGVLASLQALALELYVPIVCTAYLNRSLEHRKNKRPKLTDLNKVHISVDDLEQIVFLYRDRYYDHEGDERAELIVAKNDYGKTGTVKLAWDYATCRFEEIQKGVKSQC